MDFSNIDAIYEAELMLKLGLPLNFSSCDSSIQTDELNSIKIQPKKNKKNKKKKKKRKNGNNKNKPKKKTVKSEYYYISYIYDSNNWLTLVIQDGTNINEMKLVNWNPKTYSNYKDKNSTDKILIEELIRKTLQTNKLHFELLHINKKLKPDNNHKTAIKDHSILSALKADSPTKKMIIKADEEVTPNKIFDFYSENQIYEQMPLENCGSFLSDMEEKIIFKPRAPAEPSIKYETANHSLNVGFSDSQSQIISCPDIAVSIVKDVSGSALELASCCASEEATEGVSGDLEKASEKGLKISMSTDKSIDKAQELYASKHIKNNEKLSEKDFSYFEKYFQIRYDLFSKFDLGIEMDYEGWFSVTPEKIAKHHAQRMACNILVDAFCGAGGNTIQFAYTCDMVYAIDNNEQRLKFAQNNARIYCVKNIEFILGDFFQVIGALSCDCIFMSPPWGGPAYSKDSFYDLGQMECFSGFKMVQVAAKKTKNLGIMLPRNICHQQIIDACNTNKTGRCEIENCLIGNYQKLCTVYSGDLVNLY